MCGRPYVSQESRETEALPSETRSNAKLDYIHMTTLADASPSIPQRPIACRLAVAASLLIRTNACLPLAMGLCLARYTSVQGLALPLLRGCCCFASAKTTTHHLPVQEKSKTWQVFDVLDSIDDSVLFFFSEQMTLFRRLHCLWPRVSLYLSSPPSFFLDYFASEPFLRRSGPGMAVAALETRGR